MSCACNCCEQPPVIGVVQQAQIRWADTESYVTSPTDPGGNIPAFVSFGTSSYTEDNSGGETPDFDYFYGQYEQAGAQARNWETTAAFEGHPDPAAWWKQKASYRFKFKPSFSCYVKIEWDELTYEIDEAASETIENFTVGALLSSVPKSFEWTPPSVDGLCIPSGYDPADQSTWPVTDTFEIDVPSGARTVTSVGNIRWSVVPGYTPPSDGSANGWPP